MEMREHARYLAFDLCNLALQTDAPVAQASVTAIHAVESCLGFERGAVVLSGSALRPPRVLAHSRPSQSDEDFAADMENVTAILSSVSEAGVVRSVLDTGKIIILNDVQSASNYLAADEAIRAEACMPLIARGRNYGALNFESRRKGVFERGDITFLGTLATQLALAIADATHTGEISEGSDWRETHRIG